MAQANRQIAIRRQRENEEAIKSRLFGRSSTAAPANPDQQHCAQWMNKGSCRKGAKCNNRHDANRKGFAAVPAADIVAPAQIDVKGKGKGKGKGKSSAKGDGKGKDGHPPPRVTSQSARPCFEFSKGKCPKADKCPFTHRMLTSEEKIKRDGWARAKESQVKGGGNGTPRGGARNPNAACAAYIRGNCKKGAKCNLHHIELGDRQAVPSAPATSSSQTAGQAAVGPAIAEASGSGFVNSILRRAAPAFRPAHDSGARGSASR